MADFINLDAAYDQGTLTDWYISSVGSEPPVWTDEHIEELLNDFYVIPKHTPKADVEPVVHSYWVGEGMDVICHMCGQHPLKDMVLHSVYYWSYKPNRCPNCGAKMDEEG